MQFTIIGVGKKEVKKGGGGGGAGESKQRREWIATRDDNFAPSKMQKP